MAMCVAASGALSDCVARRHLEESGGGFLALNVRHLKGRFAGARIAALGHDDHLQVGRIPAFGDDDDGLGVADFTGREWCACSACPRRKHRRSFARQAKW